MPTPERPAKKRPAEPIQSKARVHVNDLPDRYPKAKGVAPPIDHVVAMAVPVAQPVAPPSANVAIEQAFVFDSLPGSTAPMAAAAERFALRKQRPQKTSLLPKLLSGLFMLIGGAALFVAGLQVGSWRADRRHEQELKKIETQFATLIPKADPSSGDSKKAIDVKPPVSKSERERRGETVKPEVTKPVESKRAESAATTPPKSSSLVKFDQIMPIFREKCFSCHRDKPRKSELDTRSIAALLKGGESGPAVKPGDLDSSLLWEYISRDKMPPSKENRLTAAEKMLIRDWIVGGAK